MVFSQKDKIDFSHIKMQVDKPPEDVKLAKAHNESVKNNFPDQKDDGSQDPVRPPKSEIGKAMAIFIFTLVAKNFVMNPDLSTHPYENKETEEKSPKR